MTDYTYDSVSLESMAVIAAEACRYETGATVTHADECYHAIWIPCDGDPRLVVQYCYADSTVITADHIALTDEDIDAILAGSSSIGHTLYDIMREQVRYF